MFLMEMKILFFSIVLGASFAADKINPSQCSTYPCLIFNDDFNYLDGNVWEHELSLKGGGNFEFQGYVDDRRISYTRDGILFIKPELLSDWKGEGFLSSGTLDICKGNFQSDCKKTGNSVHILNPVLSARLRTKNRFDFSYGRVEFRAKLPRGNWLWPAVWMLPTESRYGEWPASGEIDIMESRGNDNYGNIGNNVCSSTLHWGPSWNQNRYEKTDQKTHVSKGFHTWKMDWDENSIKTYLDDKLVLFVDPGRSFWEFGQFTGNNNPWAGRGKMAPFDQNFHLLLNLAVGGTSGYFPDGIDPAKPWSNRSPQAYLDFWNGRNNWLPTWKHGSNQISEEAALQIDYIKVFKMSR